MCKHLVSLVYKKRAGSSVRKAVLGYMADRASEDGEGIYTSKGRIARETEFSHSAVKKAIREFVSEGLAVVTGERKHANGTTTIYALKKAAIEALPDLQKGTTSCVTPSSENPGAEKPRHPRTPTPALGAPHPGTECPQTTLNHLEPPKEDQSSSDPCVSFEDFWEAWPLGRVGKKKAKEAFGRLSKQNKQGATDGARDWAAKWQQQNPTASPVHPTTYLNGHRWNDQFSVPDGPKSRWEKLAAGGP